MFRNMKIGLRLALGFSVVLILMIIIIVISSMQSNTIQKNLTRIVKVNNVRVELALLP